ncbi:MAG: divalent-cation tolerance protein CutA [Nitrospira sp.]|nr:divalent-cation tolerance protein CutA [Nitrospira sp.]MCP9463880.1 divalent-cation tolerance protein CutA [Nitrospira sp.]
MNNDVPKVVVVLVTVPNQREADRIAEQMVQERYVACATTVPGVQSVYWWEGKVIKEQEVLLLMKTTEAKFPLLREAILKVHPYQVPEILALSVMDGLHQYLEWVVKETS